MKGMLRYLRPYRAQCVLAPLFKMLEAGLELLIPLAVRQIVDRGIGAGDSGLVVRMVLVMALLGLVGLASSVTAQWFSARAATGFATAVRRALFEKMTRLSWADIDRAGTSTLITRMTSDVNLAQTGVNMGLRLLLRSPFVVFGAAIMAFTIDARCALIFPAVILALFVAVFGVMAAGIPMMRDVQRGLDGVLGSVRETLTGARVIRAFRGEERQLAQFDQRNGTLVRLQKRAGRVSALMNPVTMLLVDLAVVQLIRTGALRVAAGALTAGEVVALYNYMAQILVELVKLANLIVTLNRAAAGWTRISAVLQTEPGMPDAPDAGASPAGEEAVRFDRVSLRYDGAGAEALTDISFTALRGQTVGVIGGTGSGKTSLAALIPRFYDATAGAVYVYGRDVRAWRQEELRARVGFVPQKASLFRGTIRDNLLWGRPGASDAELMEAVEAAQAADVVAAKGGLDGMIEQEGRNLSGGQRQRLTIARALVRRPELLVLDDSASALDQATDRRLRGALAQLDYAPTVFIISQRTASLRGADLILVLEDGELAGAGTHETLMRDCAVYREIHLSQTEEGVSA